MGSRTMANQACRGTAATHGTGAATASQIPDESVCKNCSQFQPV